MTQVNKWLKVLVTSSMVMGSYACTDSKTVEEYQVDIAKFIEQKDHKSAIIALKNAVAIAPNNAELRFQLGNSYVNQGDYASAEKELEKAEQLGFDPIQNLPRLIETKFKLSKYDEVYTLTQAANALPDAAYVQALTYAGLSSLYQGKREQAKEYIDSANQISSESVYGQIGKAYLANTAEEAEKALEVLDSLLAYAPDIADTYLLKAYLLQGSDKHIEAANAFEEYLALRPKEYTVKFFIAQSYIQADELDKANTIVNELLKLSESHPLANQMKAQIEFGKKNYSLAQQHAITAYQGNNKLVTSTIIAGVSAYYSKEYEQAYGHLIKAEAHKQDSNYVKQLIAELQLRLGYDSDAQQTLNKLVESGDANSSLLIAASQEFINSGDNSAAQDMLKASIELGSEDPNILRQQGLMKLRLNDVASGVEFLEKSLALAPDSSQTEAGLAVAYASNNQFDKSLAIAKSWQAQDDKKIQGLLLEASLQQKQNKHKEAKELLENILIIDSNNDVAKHKLAVYAHQESDYQQAFTYYKEIIIHNSLHSGAMRGLLTLVNKNEEYRDEAERFYIAEIKNKPADNTLKLGLAYLYNIEQRYQDSLGLLKEIEKSENPIKGVGLIIGDIYLAKGELDKAIENYKEVLLVNPSNLNVHNKLISIFESQSRIKVALSQVEQAIKYHPEHIGLKLFKANFMARLQEVPSRTLMSELKNNKTVAEHWLLFSTLGHLALADKDGEAAAAFYDKAYRIKQTPYNVIQLSTALGRSGKIEDAINVLKEYLNNVEQSKNVQVMLANAYLQNNDLALAELVYIDILKVLPEHFITLNNLAYINIQQGDKTEALMYAQRAVEIAPNNPAVIDTYGQSLLINGKAKEALNEFDKALTLAPNEIEFSVNKAKALIELGKVEQAQKLLNYLNPKTNADKKLVSESIGLLN